MTQGIDDVYRINLASSGKLKLRAKGLLALGSGEDVFNACILLHEAARIEKLAVQALPVCPAVTQLTSAVEVCWCFVEGLDPPQAAAAWGDVLRASDGVVEAQADAILERLGPRYVALLQDFAHAVDASPTVDKNWDSLAHLAGLSATERTRARKELASLLKRFPGAASLWWSQYGLAEADGDKSAAWGALERATQLDTANPRFRARSYLAAAWALPTAEADQRLATIRNSLNHAGAEVCLMVACAELTLARKKVPTAEQQARLTRARDAADAGVSQAETVFMRNLLKAMQLVILELLANRKPTVDILYRHGQSELAATTKPNEDIVELLTSRLRKTELSVRPAA